jgi:ubiquinone/menaquinone biosynthesis C-methylase UbiE
LKPVDYDARQYRSYARGREMSSGQMNVWIDAFAARLPDRRPLDGLDLGSGTGRFTPALAGAFGPVTGVEPSARMRQVAETRAAHPDVRYLSGSAEAIPLTGDSVDYTLMYLVWHHVRDKPQAARDLGRVTRSGGTLLLQTQFRDYLPALWWLEYFPRGFEADASMYEPLDQVVSVFDAAGWRVSSFTAIDLPPAGTRRQVLEKLRLRTLSTFEQLTADEIAVGFERLEEAVAADPEAAVPSYPVTLLTLTRG